MHTAAKSRSSSISDSTGSTCTTWAATRSNGLRSSGSKSSPSFTKPAASASVRAWQHSASQLPATHLDERREERVEVGLAARLGVRLGWSGRKLPDPIDHHATGHHPVDDGLEPVAELDGWRHQLLAAQRPGHIPLTEVGHRLVDEIAELRPPA